MGKFQEAQASLRFALETLKTEIFVLQLTKRKILARKHLVCLFCILGGAEPEQFKVFHFFTIFEIKNARGAIGWGLGKKFESQNFT